MEPLGIDFPEMPGAIGEFPPCPVGVSFMTSQYSYAMQSFATVRLLTGCDDRSQRIQEICFFAT